MLSVCSFHPKVYSGYACHKKIIHNQWFHENSRNLLKQVISNQNPNSQQSQQFSISALRKKARIQSSIVSNILPFYSTICNIFQRKKAKTHNSSRSRTWKHQGMQGCVPCFSAMQSIDHENCASICNGRIKKLTKNTTLALLS